VGARAAVSAQRALAGVVVPIYLARIGFSAIELGVLFAVVAAVSALMSLAIGWSADRVGRKPFLILLPLFMTAAAAVFASTDAAFVLFVAAAAGSFGQGSGAGAGSVGPYQPAEQALMAGLAPDDQRNRLFGTLASASAFGALVGGLLAALPHGAGPVGPATYRPAFAAAAILAAVAALLAVPVHDPVRSRRRQRTGPARRQRLSPTSWRLVLKLWTVNASNGLAVGLFGPFVTYWFYRRFGVGTTEIGLLFAIVNAATVITNYGAAPIARRLGTVRSVVFARAGQAVLLIPLALAPSFAVAGGIYLVRMAMQRVGLALRQSFVMGAAPESERASVAALSNVPSQALSAGAPTLSGYLFESVSLSLSFELAGVLQLVNALLVHHFFAEHDRRPPAAATPPAAQADPAGRSQAEALPGGGTPT
jgi:MFS family permease